MYVCSVYFITQASGSSVYNFYNWVIFLGIISNTETIIEQHCFNTDSIDGLEHKYVSTINSTEQFGTLQLEDKMPFSFN